MEKIKKDGRSGEGRLILGLGFSYRVLRVSLAGPTVMVT